MQSPRITEKMKVAAAEAISFVGDDLASDHSVPSPLDPRVGLAAAVTTAVEE
jgi:malate dehydrogenase (oxaloacetate-decarboxylating)